MAKLYKVNILDKRYVPTLGRGPFYQVVIRDHIANTLIYRGFTLTILDFDYKLADGEQVTIASLPGAKTPSEGGIPPVPSTSTSDSAVGKPEVGADALLANPLLGALSKEVRSFYDEVTKMADNQNKSIEFLTEAYSELSAEVLKIKSKLNSTIKQSADKVSLDSVMKYEDLTTTPSTTWTMENPFGTSPVAVNTYDEDGGLIFGGVQLLDNGSRVVVNFSKPVAGHMLLTKLF